MPDDAGRHPVCRLCEREVTRTTVHHLVPKQTGRRRGCKVAELPTADLCPDCHRQLHRLYDNRELAERLASVEALRADERVAAFLAWLRKRSGLTRIRVRG